MRLLVGLILGALLTVGGAYVYDSRHALDATNSSASLERPLVNWDVVNTKLDHLGARARAEWNRLRAGSRET